MLQIFCCTSFGISCAAATTFGGETTMFSYVNGPLWYVPGSYGGFTTSANPVPAQGPSAELLLFAGLLCLLALARRQKLAFRT